MLTNWKFELSKIKEIARNCEGKKNKKSTYKIKKYKK
jgi:hypothetical protein